MNDFNQTYNYAWSLQSELSLQKSHGGHKKASDTLVPSDDEIQASQT